MVPAARKSNFAARPRLTGRSSAGVQPEKHVMGSQKLVGGEVEDITFAKIQKVLETFDDQVTFRKKQYVKDIEKRDDFLDVGFLLTDYASDFYDGKQLTLCVYI